MKWLSMLLLLPLLASAGTVYKSVDANGKITYSDQMPVQGKVVGTFAYTNMPYTPVPPRSSLPSQSASPVTAPQNAGGKPVLYMAQWCGYCTKAKAYLAEKRIAYTELDVDTPAGARAFAAVGGGKGIPVLARAGQVVRGFSRGGYDAFFAN